MFGAEPATRLRGVGLGPASGARGHPMRHHRYCAARKTGTQGESARRSEAADIICGVRGSPHSRIAGAIAHQHATQCQSPSAPTHHAHQHAFSHVFARRRRPVAASLLQPASPSLRRSALAASSSSAAVILCTAQPFGRCAGTAKDMRPASFRWNTGVVLGSHQTTTRARRERLSGEQAACARLK